MKIYKKNKKAKIGKRKRERKKEIIHDILTWTVFKFGFGVWILVRGCVFFARYTHPSLDVLCWHIFFGC